MPSQSAIAHRLNELGISAGDTVELSMLDRDLVERALNYYADHCRQVALELTLLNERNPADFYIRRRDRCHELRDIFEMSVEVRAIEVGAAGNPPARPHPDNPVRQAVNWAAGELNALARDPKAIPTFGLEPTPNHFRARAVLVKKIAEITDAMLFQIGDEGAAHTHGDIAAQDFKTVCADAVYNDSLAERFEHHANKMDEERRDQQSRYSR